MADDKPNYPVLIFLEGVTGYRQMNTFQVEELVSHGYIVVGIDQPGAAASVVFPDGHQATGSTRSLDRTFEDGIITFLAQDVIFTLDQLATVNQADPNDILRGDWTCNMPAHSGFR